MNNNIIKALSKNTLEVIILLSKGEFYLREIADILKISPSAAHAAAKILLKAGFIKVSKQKNRKIFALNQDNLLLKKIKSFINLHKILSSRAYGELIKLGIVGLYGSFSEGTNDEHSDLDLWVYSEKIDPARVSKVSASIEKELKVETNVLLLNKNKLNAIKTRDPEFYSRLKFTSTYKGETIFD